MAVTSTLKPSKGIVAVSLAARKCVSESPVLGSWDQNMCESTIRARGGSPSKPRLSPEQGLKAYLGSQLPAMPLAKLGKSKAVVSALDRARPTSLGFFGLVLVCPTGLVFFFLCTGSPNKPGGGVRRNPRAPMDEIRIGNLRN